jgi:hypothetical protein
MSLIRIPPSSTLSDGQFILITGPDGLTTGYRYDEQQRALYFKESQVIFPSFHGASHIGEDPIPNATCDSPGLMSANDKCKLDALLQTRVGVLGFSGAGFPDDGGFMQGDIILAAGTEFISLERIGNVVRFTVDSPIPLACGCEECQQIFFVQDETDISSIRPPTCGGRLPGFNAYGEMKIYLFPESTIADPNNAAATLQNKGQYPALIFKRYDDAIVPGSAEHEMVLRRDPNNLLQTEIGWAFTPGAAGVPEMVWFMGKNDDGAQIRFDLDANAEPGLLGALLFNGHLITKKMGVIIDYTSSVLTSNQYTVRQWNIDNSEAIGESFTARNVWQYINPENPAGGTNPKQLITDATIDLLPIGTLVDLWAFKVGEVGGEPILRWYFSKRPPLNPNHLWSYVGSQQFGDRLIARTETTETTGEVYGAAEVPSFRDFENTLWGLTDFDDPAILDTGGTGSGTGSGTEGADLVQRSKAVIDPDLPGLKIFPSIENNPAERPVWLWNRMNLRNGLLQLQVGRPTVEGFSLYDIAFRSPIDSHVNKFMLISGTGVLDGLNYIRVVGIGFHDLPAFGTIISNGQVFNYSRKLYGIDSVNSVMLVADPDDNLAMDGSEGQLAELLHQEYSGPVVRVVTNYNPVTDLLELQFKVGTLNMALPFEGDATGTTDDYIRGLSDGYAVSAIYSQAGLFSGVGTAPSSSPEGFVYYEGGAQTGGELDEYWNSLEIMVRDQQVWIWWNKLLVPPNSALSANLPSPVNIDTPYFTADTPDFGKYGCRLWPGNTVRKMELRTQATVYSEFTSGQLEVV